MPWVSEELKKIASGVDLYEYMKAVHPGLVRTNGNRSLKYLPHDSLIINQGRGYYHNSQQTSGNAIKFLRNYMDMSYYDACVELCNFCGGVIPESSTTQSISYTYERDFHIPEPVSGGRFAYKRLYGYLIKNRMLPDWMVNRLIEQNLLYQTVENNNICFINSEKDYIEIRGSLSDKRFCQDMSSRIDGYWSFTIGKPERVYICEGAIDAISLYLLLKHYKKNTNGMYVSIGGAAKQPAINRIKSEYDNVYIAVDNDPAGDKCFENNSELHRILPKNKDWNEDWKALQ